jgi:hypothetical protein
MSIGNASEKNEPVKQPEEVTTISQVNDLSKALYPPHVSSSMDPANANVSPRQGEYGTSTYGYTLVGESNQLN